MTERYWIDKHGKHIIVNDGTYMYDLMMVLCQIGRGNYTSKDISLKFRKRRTMYNRDIPENGTIITMMNRVARIFRLDKTKNYKTDEITWNIDKAFRIDGDEIVAI